MSDVGKENLGYSSWLEGLRRSLFFLLWLNLLVFATLIYPNRAWGQGTTNASIAGVVHDPSGAVVPGAAVTVTQTNTGLSRTVTVAEDGRFVFPTLPVGPYQLEVKKEGFATYRQSGIILTVNQTADLPVTLTVGAIQQTVEVKESPSSVETTTGTLSQIIDQRQVVELPLNGRNPAELVLVAPGVVNMLGNGAIPPLTLQFTYPAAGVGVSSLSEGAQAPVVNGTRPGNVYFSLDGANNTDPYSISSGPFPNPDAVQEFRVLTSGYGAEYVSAAGGVVNIVTKSGTNQFHGSVFEFLRNGAFNAKKYFAAHPDNIKRNQFGGAAGGPIVKDKLFIFGSFQDTILRQNIGGNIEFVPTDAERAGNFAAIPVQLKNPFTGRPYPGNQIPVSDFNPITAAILAHLPHATAPDGRVEVVQYTPQDEKQLTLRGDYWFGKQRIVGRYLYSDFSEPRVPNNNWLAGNQGGQVPTYHWQDAMIGHNYAGGHWANEFRFAVQRNWYQSSSLIQQNIADLGANISTTSNHFMESTAVGGFFTLNSGSAENFPRTTYVLSERLYFARGRHELSFGAEVSRLQAKETTDHLQSGAAQWGSLPPQLPFTSGYPLSDFLLGKVTAFQQGDGLLVRVRGTLWGFSATDQIRVTPRLNLTLGLRWDPYWPFRTLFGRMNCFNPGQQSTVFTNPPPGVLFPGDRGCDESGTSPDLHTFQPRIGLAYRLDQKGTTSVRAGYGLYTTQFPMQMYLPFGQTPPYIRQINRSIPFSISNPWLGTPPFSPNQPGGDPFASGFHNNDLPLPSSTPFALPVSIAAISHNFKLGNLQKWNLILEHSFGTKNVARASYVGEKGTHLSIGRQNNPAIFIPGQCGPAPCSSTANTDARRLYAPGSLGSVLVAESTGYSNYNALQLSFERRMTSSLNFSANYTWSKSIDIQSQVPNNNACCTAFFDIVSNPFNINAFRSVSDFNVPHSLSATAVWQLPSFTHDNLFLKYVGGGWQVSGIWQWQTGLPFTVFSGMDNSLSGIGWDHADRMPGVSPTLDSGRPHAQLIQRYFNTAAFRPNATGTFGNSGRNMLTGPGYNNLDMSLAKTFPLHGERYRMTFRSEFFNVTNTSHFAIGPQLFPSPAFGQITATRDPRILQFALKLNW